jgi:hypothetical protein
VSLLTKIYDTATIKDSYMVLDGNNYGIKKGKHAIWVPLLPGKIIWSFQGKITPFNYWRNGKDQHNIKYKSYYNGEGFERESLVSIVNEYKIFELMASRGYSPNVHGIFHIRSVTSDFLGSSDDKIYTDNKGVYGIFIDDAYKIDKPGRYKFDDEADDYGYYRVDYLPDGFENEVLSLLDISEGAKGDMKKRDNVVNGFVIDVRRTLWDMMKLKSLDENLYREILR